MIALCFQGTACAPMPIEQRPPSPQSLALADLDERTSGILGACVGRPGAISCVNGDRPMPMQSVMKVLVALAALDAVDRGVWRLAEEIVLYPRDLSISVQPIASLVTPSGYRTTVGDLIRRSIIDSDSAATDVLIDRLGGVAAVQAVLHQRNLKGIRIDRDERRLQTDVLGLGEWRIALSDSSELRRAIAATPDADRDAAWSRYRADIRDTATARGMAELLLRLDSGELLSPGSTRFLLQALLDCRTFPDRLMAGVPVGWRVAHKTGSSGEWRGLSAAVNDVGLVYSSDGLAIAAVAFLADTADSSEVQSATIAQVATIATSAGR